MDGEPGRIVGFATFYPLEDKKVIELAAGIRHRGERYSKRRATLQIHRKETFRVKDTPGLTFRAF